MALQFAFSPDKGETPEALAKRRAVANALFAQNQRTPQNLGEGLHSIGRALMYRQMMGDVSAGEKAGQESAQAAFNPVLEALMGGGSASRVAPGSAGPEEGMMGPHLPVSPQYLDDIKGFEGYTPKAQWDYKQNSIGYGTKAKHPGEVIDQDEANRRLITELSEARSNVDKFAPNTPEGAKSALTSLTYNAGPSWMQAGLGEAVQSGDLDTAQQRFRQYNRAGGEVLPGLVSRRNAEAQWFDEGGAKPIQTAQAGAPDMGTLMKTLQNPWLNDSQRSVVQALLQRQMQANDPKRQLELETARTKLQSLQQEQQGRDRLMTALGFGQPQPAPQQPRDPMADALGMQSLEQMGGQQAPQPQPGIPGINRDAAARVLALGGSPEEARKAALAPDPNIPKGYQRSADGGIEPMAGSADALKRQEGQRADQKAYSYAADSMDQLYNSAKGVFESPGLGRITGLYGSNTPNISDDSRNAQAKLETLKNKVAFNALQAMRDASKTGGALGNVTERELAMLQNSLYSLDQAQSFEEMQRALAGIAQFAIDSKKRMQDAFEGSNESSTPSVPEGWKIERVN